MTYNVTLKDQVNAHTSEISLVLAWREGVPMRLSDLIRERVSMEWNLRHDATGQSTRPLVEIADNRGARNAQQSGEINGCAPNISQDGAVKVALDGFRRSAFFVVVGDRQLTNLDDEIMLTASTEITFIRLLPLVGG